MEVSPHILRRMRRRVIPETFRPSSNGDGSVVAARLPACWAHVEPLRRVVGDERDVLDHRVVLRARKDLRIGDRLHDGDRILAIAVLTEPSNDRRFLLCLCREIAGS